MEKIKTEASDGGDEMRSTLQGYDNGFSLYWPKAHKIGLLGNRKHCLDGKCNFNSCCPYNDDDDIYVVSLPLRSL